MRFLIILMPIILSAGLFEEFYKFRANKFYSNNDFNKTVIYLNQIENKNDTINLKIANSYYRLKQYSKALLYYKKIKYLHFIKYYNMANCYFKLSSYNRAKDFYKAALKFKNDKDAIYNLNLTLKLLRAKRDKKIEPKSSLKEQGYCKLFEGSNPLFKDDNKTFYGTLAKFKTNKRFMNNIAKKEGNSDTFYSKIKNSEAKKPLANEKFNAFIKNKYDTKLKNRDLKTILILLENR